jgi:hypothetical protein
VLKSDTLHRCCANQSPSGVIAASIRLYTFFQWTPRKGDADKIRIAANLEMSAYLTVACLLHMKALLNHIRKGSHLVPKAWTSRYYGDAASTQRATGLSTLDRRTSRRLPSASENSSEGDLIRADEEHGLSEIRKDGLTKVERARIG